MSFESFVVLLQDEATAWEEINSLRQNFHPNMAGNIPVHDRKSAFERGLKIIKCSLEVLSDIKPRIYEIEPGFGVGTIVRDYVNALMLFSELEAKPQDIVVGLVAGTLQRLGLAYVGRYEESSRVVRHPDVTALLWLKVIYPQLRVKMDIEEALAIAYALLAVSHYTKPFEIKCASDGVTRTTQPFDDLDANGQPVWPVWYVRWLRRLQNSGPVFVGRHYLTRWQDHEDYNGNNFFHDVHSNYMEVGDIRPLSEQFASKNQRMIEHFHMFATSQSNDSIYGKHDYGTMITMRDGFKRDLLKIIQTAQDGGRYSEKEMSVVQLAFTYFLGLNIDHTAKGLEVAMHLDDMNLNLNSSIRQHWTPAFIMTMKKYISWSEKAIAFFFLHDESWINLGFISSDVRQVIRPDKRWVDLIVGM